MTNKHYQIRFDLRWVSESEYNYVIGNNVLYCNYISYVIYIRLWYLFSIYAPVKFTLYD